MSRFIDTPEGEAFIASAASRETSPEIMQAIAFMARNSHEAESVWNGDLGSICTLLDLWEHVTKNGLREASKFYWGDSGSTWWRIGHD